MAEFKIQIDESGKGFSLYKDQTLLIHGSDREAAVYLGTGTEDVKMYGGHFKVGDYVTERRPLYVTELTRSGNSVCVDFEGLLQMNIASENGSASIEFSGDRVRYNRFWLRILSDPEEHYYGCGEQMSYFDLKGRHFPIWTTEPGVGRDPSTLITWKAENQSHSGGDYYTTYFPEPTFVSSKHYFLHTDSTAYADFDFRHSDFTELQFWEIPSEIRLGAADDFPALLEKLTALLGRQPELPEWIYNGMILGLQGGTARTMRILEKSEENGIRVAAVWCQDWCGKRITSFGKRLNWRWKYFEEMYPNLPETIQTLNSRDIRFMGYINPYLLKGCDLYLEAEELGYFVHRTDGSVYLVNFGEFWCGIIDLTNPAACRWYKERVIQKEMLGIGLSGWMADFGEYLPVEDVALYDGTSAMEAHNAWPALWAKLNYEAVSEAGKLGDAVYFMRSGGTGSQKYCTLLWAGDQSVDFSRHDGLITTVAAALSAGMTGCGLNHSDIGGYTSLFDNLRTRELFLRWAEMAVFTPVMRTHEGNRPDTNFQYYDDEDCMRRLGRMTEIHAALAPYIKNAVHENSEKGLPVQRPLFMYYEKEARAYTEQFEYLFGRDLLVAPVWHEGENSREVYLPADEWVHLWNGQDYSGGVFEISAPIGYPPVFYRKKSAFAKLFSEL